MTLSSSLFSTVKRSRIIWLPVDFYLGISRSRKRLLEVPTVSVERARTRAVRIEATLVISFCFILDFSPMRL